MPKPAPSYHLPVTLQGEAATRALGEAIAVLLRAGDMVTLAGALGAGKSTLARALIRAFLPGEDVPSPTFTLVQTYRTAHFTITHADLYRIKSAGELRELALDEALDEGVLLIEWPDRLGTLLPGDRLDVMLEGSGEERIAKLVGRGVWAERLKALVWKGGYS